MKTLIACALFAAACALPALAEAGGTLSYSQDARTQGSDEQVRVERRAYRAQCERYQSVAYCECMTGGMAQSLSPRDLHTATLLLAHDLGHGPLPVHLDHASVEAARAASAEFEPGCAQYRR